MECDHASLADRILSAARAHHKPRFLVAIAGPPGSGKTTTAHETTEVVKQYLASGGHDHIGQGRALDHRVVSLLSMDGFHKPRSVLDTLPNRDEAYIRRGAPWTFDVELFVQAVRELREWANAGTDADVVEEQRRGHRDGDRQRSILLWPTFDHKSKDPIKNGAIIDGHTQIVILEGNYLLLDEPGWRDVSPLVDLRVFRDVDLNTARDRLARRHVGAGIESTLEDAYRRVDQNDYLNAMEVRAKLVRPDFVMRSVSKEES